MVDAIRRFRSLRIGGLAEPGSMSVMGILRQLTLRISPTSSPSLTGEGKEMVPERPSSLCDRVGTGTPDQLIATQPFFCLDRASLCCRARGAEWRGVDLELGGVTPDPCVGLKRTRAADGGGQ
jgi:hypothetical protein